MEGMTRTELDKVESKDLAQHKKPMRPRDAATLILLERTGGTVNVLMGRRHMNHAFMPGKFVFPGGRTDPSDSRIAVASGLHPDEERKLTGQDRISSARARAIALSAIRETYEEAGLLIGERGDFSTPRHDWQGFADHGVRPSLGALRYIARAITPPGRIRRFDTRFFSAWRSDITVALPEGGPTEELEGIVWLPLKDAIEADIATITQTILKELSRRLDTDPDLNPGGPVPFYRMIHKRFVRDVL